MSFQISTGSRRISSRKAETPRLSCSLILKDRHQVVIPVKSIPEKYTTGGTSWLNHGNVDILEPRVNSVSQGLRQTCRRNSGLSQSHPKKSGLEPYSKLNWGRSYNPGPINPVNNPIPNRIGIILSVQI